jgi:hypothetical protein
MKVVVLFYLHTFRFLDLQVHQEWIFKLLDGFYMFYHQDDTFTMVFILMEALVGVLIAKGCNFVPLSFFFFIFLLFTKFYHLVGVGSCLMGLVILKHHIVSKIPPLRRW